MVPAGAAVERFAASDSEVFRLLSHRSAKGPCPRMFILLFLRQGCVVRAGVGDKKGSLLVYGLLALPKENLLPKKMG